MMTHTTKDGTTTPIAAMSDSHLTNTINYVCRKIDECKTGLGSAVAFTPLQMALYDIDEKVLSESSAEGIRNMLEALVPYVFEATLRGLAVTAVLQSTFERTGKEENAPLHNTDRMLGAFDDDQDYPCEDNW